MEGLADLPSGGSQSGCMGVQTDTKHNFVLRANEKERN